MKLTPHRPRSRLSIVDGCFAAVMKAGLALALVLVIMVAWAQVWDWMGTPWSWVR